MKIEDVRGALLTVLMRKHGLEQELKSVEKQIDGLVNQLHVLEQLKNAEADKAEGDGG